MEMALIDKRLESSVSPTSFSLFNLGTTGMLTGLANLGVREYWLKGQDRIVDLLADTKVELSADSDDEV